MFGDKKRGTISTGLEIIIGLVFALFIIFTFIFIINNFESLFDQSKVICNNRADWSGITSLLDSLKEGVPKSLVFYNDNCNLVSFSLDLGLQNHKILPDFEIQKNPKLCLCKVVDAKLCQPYRCYKFKNIDVVVDQDNKPFSSFDLLPYTYLTFNKAGNKLIIQAQGNLKSPEPIEGKLDFKELNKNGLLNKIIIIFNTRSVQAFYPIVDVKSKDLFTPENLPKSENLPFLFDIDLALPFKEETTAEEFKNNHESIPSIQVLQAYVELNIPKDSFIGVDVSNLFLYYKVDNLWKSSSLVCEPLENFYTCKSLIKGFSREFAISIPSVTVAYISNTELEGQLTPNINRLSSKYGVDPFFVKAIIQQESSWDPNVQSKKCAAGLMQLMPGTASDLGLKTFENHKTNDCDSDYVVRLSDIIKSNPSDAKNKDERFDIDLALEAGIKYLSQIKNILIKKNIEPSLENIAASYNAGPGKVLASNGVPDIEETKNYVTKVINYYNQLSSNSFILAGDKVWPVDNPVITSCYGYRGSPTSSDVSEKEWHDGIDFGVPVGTPVYSVAEGTVINAHECADNCDKGSGNSLIIKHVDAYTGYLHLSKIFVQNGEKISKGQIIAESGNTGRSTGPHLHFNVYFKPDFSPDVGKGSLERDPLLYLPKLHEYKLHSRSCAESPTLIALREDPNIKIIVV